MENADKIILDLCGGTGAWSKPYAEKGYRVINITLPDFDLTDETTVAWCIAAAPYGILFACPCDIWSNAGSRFWPSRTSDQVLYHASILVKGLRIIMSTRPVFWCLENPIGKMIKFMGKPAYSFHPYYFGDPYTKRSYLWGNFNIPKENKVKPVIINPVTNAGSASTKRETPISWLIGKNRKEKRAITPPGFANAFCRANP